MFIDVKRNVAVRQEGHVNGEFPVARIHMALLTEGVDARTFSINIPSWRRASLRYVSSLRQRSSGNKQPDEQDPQTDSICDKRIRRMALKISKQERDRKIT